MSKATIPIVVNTELLEVVDSVWHSAHPMDREHSIWFDAGPAFSTKVVGEESESRLCIPIVWSSWTGFGPGIIYGDKSLVWGVMARDLVTSWRATLFLPYLANIGKYSLAAAYYAAKRDLDEAQIARYRRPAVNALGQESYDEIMATLVPEMIIERVLRGSRDEDALLYTDLGQITEEVRAGTIEWREEFAKVGVDHPVDVDERSRVFQENVHRHDSLLDSIARHFDITRDSTYMERTEIALNALVLQGADTKMPAIVLAALAMMVSDLSFGRATDTQLRSLHFLSPDDEKIQSEETKDTMRRVAFWVANAAAKRWQFRKRYRIVYETIHLLETWLEKYVYIEPEVE